LDQEQDMGRVATQVERDMAIYRAHVDGARQDELAQQYGVTQQAISQAIARVQASLPAPEREQEIRRTLHLVDDLMSVYVPKARNGNPAASREVRGYLTLRGRYLGIDRREVEHTGQVTFEHTYEPGPTVAEVLDDWRRRGILRGEITRGEPA
jgi:hypothetical protein